MAEQPAGEKTEDATPRRKQEARKKGTVARSTDLNGALVMLGVALVLPGAASQFGLGMMQALRATANSTPNELNTATLARGAWLVAMPCFRAAAMILGTAMVVGTISNLAQVGFAFSPEVLKPSLAKLNLLEGAKRMLSVRGAVEGLKALAKTVIFGLMAASVIRSRWEQLLSLGAMSSADAASIIGNTAHSILLRIGVAWLVLAALDYFFQRRQVDKQLRMTKDELKREMKEQEGSPEVKQSQYRRRRELLKRRSLDVVRTADVVITNPTHYAVAIVYKRSEMHAPVVVAKGVDFLALKIREIAAEARVPIVPNPPIARALYKQCEVGDFVPRDMFGAVAEVLAYVYQTLQKTRRAG